MTSVLEASGVDARRPTATMTNGGRAAGMVLALLMFTGCASSGPVAAPVPSFSSTRIEEKRAECMTRDGLWMETREHFVCRERGKPDADT
ncbi:MAG: hypothetical protein Q8S13_11010 [Dehalococcoidia bacterium]|nr:hypothetical protein [Dehalococcoidia bacterium]